LPKAKDFTAVRIQCERCSFNPDFQEMTMRTVLLSLIFLLTCAFSVPAKAATFNDDFSGGIRPEFWDIVHDDATDAPWVIAAPDSFGGLQVSKAADSDPLCRRPSGGITSRFQFIGDFSASVSFNLVTLPLSNNEGWNEPIMNVGFSTPGTIFEVLRFAGTSQWAEVWETLPTSQKSLGAVYDDTVQGSFSLTRRGATLSAWIDRGSGPVLVASDTSSLFLGPAYIELLARQQSNANNSRPSNAIDVRYDNLSVTAEAIIPEPSTFVLLGMGVILSMAYGWRHQKCLTVMRLLRNCWKVA
jgi:hypothetical protein